MPDVLTVKAQAVTDGDTITCVGSAGGEITVRVWGIDAPESSQPYGPEATRLARDLAEGALVSAYVQDTGPYGRHIARVEVDPGGESVDLARSLALSGLAWHSRQYPTSDALVACEKEARANDRGLWAQADPTPPWAWRDAQGETGLLDAIHEGVDTAKEGYRWGRWLWRLFS